MAVYVVYGIAGFTTATRRNRVANRATNAATNGGFTPSSRVPGYAPGVTSINYTVPADSDDTTTTPGATYPAVTICFEHTDQAAIDQAAQTIQDELTSQGVLFGNFGTWTDFSG